MDFLIKGSSWIVTYSGKTCSFSLSHKKELFLYKAPPEMAPAKICHKETAAPSEKITLYFPVGTLFALSFDKVFLIASSTI